MKILRKLCLLFLTLFLLTGCVSSSKQYIAYTVYPIGYLLNQIGGDRINTVTIQTNTMVQDAEIVDNYEEILNDTVVLFHIGDLEPYMDLYSSDIVNLGVDLTVGDLSSLNYIYEYQRYRPVYLNGSVSYIESSFYSGDAFNTIDYYDYDPFIWLLPSGMLSMAESVCDYLSSNYIEQSEFFEENYETLSDKLISLDAKYTAFANSLVKNNETVKFVSISGSFSGWQKDFNIQVYPVCLSKYGALPTDEQLAIIEQQIINDGVTYIAYEPNMSDKQYELFQKLESDLGLTRVTLNNLSSLVDSQVQSGNDYFTLMYDNLAKLENMVEPMSTSTGSE